MLKNIVCVFLAAVFCCIALLGTGFAAWMYGNGIDAKAPLDIGVKITESTVVGRFEVPEIWHVVLDGGTGSGYNPTITGISFYKNDGENGNIPLIDSDFVIQFQVDEDEIEIINQEYDKLAFGFRIEIPDALKPYIDYTDWYKAYINRGQNGYIDLKQLTIDLTDHFDDPEYTRSNFSYDKATGLFSFAISTTAFDRFFTYVKTEKPITLDKYGALPDNVRPFFIIELWQGWQE